MNHRRRPHAGFTLPEVLVSMVVASLLVTSLAFAFSVVARNQGDAEQRLSESRDVTFVQTWLPADLSSATQSWLEPQLPFPVVESLPGTNVVTVARPDVDLGTQYLIAYRYEEVPGNGWALARYRIDDPGCPTATPLFDACNGPESVKRIGVAYELPDPPAGWDTSQAPTHAVEVARRNSGGAGSSGAPVGQDVTVKFVSGSVYIAGGSGLSAGQQIDPSPQVIPDPVAPPSRCGRRVLLLLDLSTSVINDWSSADDAPGNMRAAATSFVTAFQGTPGSMSVLGYDKWIEPISGNPGEYFDLLNDPTGRADWLVNEAFPDMTTGNGAYNASTNPYGFGPHSFGNTGGGTHWEAALYSAFAMPRDWQEIDGTDDDRTKDRSDLEYLATVPDLVVMITDGQPTRRFDERFNYTNFNADGDNHQRVTDQAAAAANLAREFGVEDVVGVLVGSTNNVGKLEQVVGGTAWNGLPGSDPNSNADLADYFAADFAQLGDVVRSIVQRECGGALTLQKRFTDGTDPSTTGVWEFFNDEQGTKTLDYGSASSVTFQHTFQEGSTSHEFLIEERPRDGWVLDDVTCEVGGQPLTDPTRVTREDPDNPGDPVRYRFTLQADEAMSCLVISRPA